jgi:hypothetical protein
MISSLVGMTQARTLLALVEIRGPWAAFDVSLGFVRATAGRRLRMAQHGQTQAVIKPRGRATRPTRRLVFVCRPGE